MHPTPRIAALATLAAVAVLPLTAAAQTTITDAWVRGTVAPQTATGMFARIHSAQGGRLVAASSPLAGTVEIHEMAMDGNVMRMRALPQGVALPAGSTVALKPGGLHLMLIDLKRPLAAGDTVPMTLTVEGRDGRRERFDVAVPVKPLAHAGGAGGAHGAHGAHSAHGARPASGAHGGHGGHAHDAHAAPASTAGDAKR